MASTNPTDSLEAPPQPRTAYKPKRTRKAPAIQSAILAKRASGHSKAKIAKELDIAINTVTNVIELNDFDRTLQTEQGKSLGLIPRAIQVAHDRLTKGSENMAIKVLENTIWPLNAKTSKQQDPHLTLAIQNLMGNVTVGQSGAQPAANQPQTTTNGVLPESSDTSTKPTSDK